jgi:hypothetical protein
MRSELHLATHPPSWQAGKIKYTQGGHKLRFFRRRKARFVTVGIIKIQTSELYFSSGFSQSTFHARQALLSSAFLSATVKVVPLF